MATRRVKKKINLMGDPKVGKTSLILRFVNDVYGDEYLKTIGTTVYSKNVPVIGAEVKLVIQDIMGEKGYETVKESAFNKSSGAIAVADVTRMETLNNLIDDWIPKYRSIAGNEAPVILAINKMDLAEKEISKEYVIEEVSSRFSYVFFTSAKTGKGVEDAFSEMASRALFRTPLRGINKENLISETPLRNPKELISASFAFSAEFGDISYSKREEILEESGIDKYSLDDDIEEKKALRFTQGLINWYEEEGDKDSAAFLEKILEKYENTSHKKYY